MHPRLAWLTNERVRLTLSLTLLASLVAYGISSGPGLFGIGNNTSTAGSEPHCPYSDAPAVASVSRSELLRLRGGLRRIVYGRSRRLYEQGLVPSDYAWSDGEPGMHRSLPVSPRLQGGYELRWWLASGDDLVPDVWVFADRRQAQDFFRRASSDNCRLEGATFPAPFPPRGRNLVWRNPDGFAQEDVFLLRGRRVYRVGVVLAGLGDLITPGTRRLGFSLVDGLACALPYAYCDPQSGRATRSPT